MGSEMCIRDRLNSLNDATEGTQDAVDAMEDLEPLLKSIGELAGESVTDIAYLASALGDVGSAAQGVTENAGMLGPVFDGVRKAVAPLINPLGFVADSLRAIRGETGNLTGSGSSAGERGSLRDLEQQTEETTEAFSDYRFEVQGAQAALARMYAPLSRVNEETEDLTGNTGGAAKATDELTKKQKDLVEAYEAQGIAFATSREELLEGIRVLDDATRAVEEYANTIQDDLLEAFDLVGLYDAAKESGGDLAENMEEGLNTAFAHMEWGGNVLNALKAANVPQGLIEYLSSIGPEGGWELGQAMLSDDGLKGSIESGWTKIQDKTRELAHDLVPEFLEAGRLGAIAKLDGLAMQFAEDQRKFKRLGNKLGQQVGDSFSERMLKEIAEAVRQVEALATAARAEKVAAAQAEQSRITEQAVATAISQLIRNSDQRSGRNVQPVL